MAENKVIIGATLKADGSQANETVKSFKTQLREANEELLKTQDRFGALSPAAIEAAKKVADLRDKIEESKEVAELFDPGKKFQALANVAAVAASGFSALQGAINLVGVESENVEKAILKVQSAMAIADGFSAIADGAKDFERLGLMIKQSTAFQTVFNAATKAASVIQKAFGVAVDTTSTSFKVLRGAIIATGIGALVVGLGFAIEKLMSLANRSKEAADRQKELADRMKEAGDASLQAGLAFLESYRELDIARAKSRGASEREIFEIEQKYHDSRIEQMQKHLGQVKDQNALVDKIAEEGNKKEINRLNFEAEQRKKAADKQKEANDKAIAEAKRRKDELARQKQAEIDAAKKLNAELRKENEVNYQENEESAELTKLRQEYDDKAAILIKGGETLVALEARYAQQQYEIKKKYRDQEKADDAEAAQQRQDEMAALDQQIQDNLFKRLDAMADANEQERNDDQATYDNKVLLAQATGNVMAQLSGLIGDQTAVGKGLALGQVAIDTGVAISALVRNSETNPSNAYTFGGAGAIQFATGIARILANVAQARRIITSAPGVKGGSGGGNLNLSAGNSTAPLKPQLPQTTTTALDQNTLNNMANMAVRAFVLETDVTNNQNRVRELNRRARIG